MTREHKGLIEYQSLYLPKSISASDLTVFRWDKDILHVWLECSEAARLQKHDVTIFSKSPWDVFGITNVTIQSRIGSDQSVVVSGILRCDPSQGGSSVDQLNEYLKYQEGDPDWIAESMLAEPLPAHFSRHVSDQSVYWVDSRTGMSTWAHPLYGKYQMYLTTARKKKPLSDAKSILQFQLECFFTTKPIESIETLREIARILRVDLLAEPYMSELIKTAFVHFSLGVTSNKIRDMEARISRKRREIEQLEQSVTHQQRQAETASLCVECETNIACMHCSDCCDFFCRLCFLKTHSSGARKYSHKTSLVELILCVDCETQVALLECKQCLTVYCANCFGTFHMRGGRTNHIAVAVRTGQPRSTLSTNRYLLETAKSPWISVADRFYNLQTEESQRDPPLAPVNA